MNFPSALISMKHGHLVRRKHWNSSLMLGTDNELYFVSYSGPTIPFRSYPDMMFLLESMACDDWIIDDGMVYSDNLDDSYEHGDNLKKVMQEHMEKHVLRFTTNQNTINEGE